MQAHSRSEPYTLLEYQSGEPRVFGVEVRPKHESGFESLLAGLRWVGKSEAFSKELTFLVMALPTRTVLREIRQIAACASAEGLTDKLRLVAPADALHLSTTITQLQRLGIRVLLGGVGASSRFSDMTDHQIDGIVIEPRLLSDASGDPLAASILDAIVALSTSLGLKSFANDCATQTEFDFATSAGISYVTYTSPNIERGGELAAVVGRGRTPKQPAARSG